MRSHSRYWSSLIWSFWIVLLTVVTATACVGHPDAHHAAHPPLCIDSSSPVAQRNDRLILFTDDETFPLPRISLVPVASPASMRAGLLLGLPLSPDRLSGMDDRISVRTPCAFLPVLRL